MFQNQLEENNLANRQIPFSEYLVCIENRLSANYDETIDYMDIPNLIESLQSIITEINCTIEFIAYAEGYEKYVQSLITIKESAEKYLVNLKAIEVNSKKQLTRDNFVDIPFNSHFLEHLISIIQYFKRKK